MKKYYTYYNVDSWKIYYTTNRSLMMRYLNNHTMKELIDMHPEGMNWFREASQPYPANIDSVRTKADVIDCLYDEYTEREFIKKIIRDEISEKEFEEYYLKITKQNFLSFT